MRTFFYRLLLVLTCCVWSLQAFALGYIRDAEIEHYLHDLSDPIFRTAGLPPKSVHLFIVQQDSINAFVAGGSNIFLHTGLLLKAQDPETLIGVIAHETGHIAGGHLIRGMEQLETAQIGTVLSYVLGAAAAAAGAGDAGMAVMSAGGHLAERGVLANSRTNEESADQAALRFLDANQMSASGMLAMFETLRRQEKQRFATLDPYALTHPLSAERISYIRHHLEGSPFKDAKLSDTLHTQHERMLGKLEGFINDPDDVLARYAITDASIKAQIARVVALYRKPDIEEALRELDGLLKQAPEDAYFHELKGQILFEHGRIPEAITAYARAHELAKDASLITVSYAQALLASPNLTPPTQQEAIRLLTQATADEPSYDLGWQLLAEAQGKAGNKGAMYLALAEKALLQQEIEQALNFSQKAMDTLPAGSPARQRANDIHSQAARLKEAGKEKPSKN